MSIGEVLGSLRSEFPHVSISKIRFLESEGLVDPARTPSGYRKFSAADVERLRYVLTAQRDQYLPLRVIKANLDALDRGLELPGSSVSARPRVPRAVTSPTGKADDEEGPAPPLRLSRAELAEAADVSVELLDEIESFGLVTARKDAGSEAGCYDAEALAMAEIVAAMSSYGVEPRHLRVFRTAAQRQSALVEQVVAPLSRQRSAQARARAEEAARELTALSLRLHTALMRAAMRPLVGG